MEDDFLPPTWVEEPVDQRVEFGDDFYYDLDATDPSGVATWELSESTYFTINSEGVITNIVALPVGVYELQVSVRDTKGNTNNQIFTVTVEDTTPPIWTTPPTDQNLDYGASLDLQLEAWDLSGISTWQLSDTTHFAIDSTGRITSVGILVLDFYSLDVMVEDPYGNALSSEFSVRVNRETITWFSQIPGFPFPSIILGIFGVIVVGLILRRRKPKH
jgi:hypothetical protein